jgi:hypothetical protein
MNQRETLWLRIIIFLSLAILVVVSSVAIAKPTFAQGAPANFDAVDDYISTRMKELGIPGAALEYIICGADQSNDTAERFEIDTAHMGKGTVYD